MLCGLKEILALTQKGRSAVAAFNVYGFEDAHGVVQAASRLGRPVILMANRDAVGHMGADLICHILRREAQAATVPVCVHLDHAMEPAEIRQGIAAGFSSVMMDASARPYEENVALTRSVAEVAHPLVGVEGEIGQVGYSDLGTPSTFTAPEEAARFAADTGVDALAVAVGTVHRMQSQEACLQFELLEAIAQAVEVPLVIHGASGVADEDLRRLVAGGAQKINLGTALRMAFGHTLRRQLEEDPAAFDRIKLFPKCMKAVEETAAEKIKLVSGHRANG